MFHDDGFHLCQLRVLFVRIYYWANDFWKETCLVLNCGLASCTLHCTKVASFILQYEHEIFIRIECSYNISGGIATIILLLYYKIFSSFLQQLINMKHYMTLSAANYLLRELVWWLKNNISFNKKKLYCTIQWNLQYWQLDHPHFWKWLLLTTCTIEEAV